MEGFINLLEEYKQDDQDSQIIADFKDKINKPIEYKQHLNNFKFDKEWFSILDDILVELGYRALDANINHIKKELKNKIYDTHIDKIDSSSTIVNLLSVIENKYLSSNDSPEVVKYLIDNPDKIDWNWFSVNDSDIAVKYLLEHPDKIYWNRLSVNDSDIAVKYLLEHPDKIYWNRLSVNKSDIAVKYLLEHPDKIKWDWFSRNASDIAVRYLLEHPDKIDWTWLSCNKNILAVKYCLKNNKKTEHNYLLLIEYINDTKITSFNKLGWLPKSKLLI